MGFSDKLQINKVTTKEPENTEEWLQRFIEIILKENSKSQDRQKQSQKERKINNGTAQ